MILLVLLTLSPGDSFYVLVKNLIVYSVLFQVHYYLHYEKKITTCRFVAEFWQSVVGLCAKMKG